MPKPIVAIAGRPNVGKSHLFNRLVQKKIAIVEDEPGVTRDRLYAMMEWQGEEFILVDTGGIESTNSGLIKEQVRQQAELAILEADVVLFVVDGQDGLTAGDLEVAELLHRIQKPVQVVVNKVDHPKMEAVVFDFYSLGLGEVIPVSAEHGINIGDLLDLVVSLLPKEITTRADEEKEDLIKIAVVGKPNTGKSSIVNRILGEQRVIVSSEAGTTRDAIDTRVELEDTPYLLIDTAGLRRPSRIEIPTERYSVFRALRAIDRSDIALLVIDAVEGVTEQDKRIAGYVHEAGRGLIIAVNKWDLIIKDTKTTKKHEEEIRRELPFLHYAPLLFISALTGQRVTRLLPLAREITANSKQQIITPELNRLIREVVELKPPPSRKGRQVKIYYALQTNVQPPTFLLFVNDPRLLHFSYLRYLENKLRESFHFSGTPLRIIARKRK